MISSAVVIAALAAAPCQKAVLIPLEPIATTPQVAKAVELKTREALAATPGICLEERADTVKRLLPMESHRLPACRDFQCASAQLTALEIDLLVQGVVIGAGGEPTLELTITRARGSVRAVGSPDELPALLAVGLNDEDAVATVKPLRWPWIAAGSAGLVSLGIGAGFGIGSSERARILGTSNAGCANDSGFPGCIDTQLRMGKGEATAANVLFAVGGTLLAAALILWVVELP